MLDMLKTDDSIQEEGDYIGGQGLESGAYDMVIDMAYFDKSKGEAISLNLSFKNADGKSLKQTLWLTSGKAKGQKNYYEDKSGKRRYLPGFTVANNICQLTLGKEISELEPEDKTINVYNPELKKEAPTVKPVLMDLLNQEVCIGVIKQIVDKNVKDANGNYVPSGETRNDYVIDKVFNTEHQTITELKGNEPATFYDTWVEKNTGKVVNKATGASGDTPTSTATPAAAPKKSLFG